MGSWDRPGVENINFSQCDSIYAIFSLRNGADTKNDRSGCLERESTMRTASLDDPPLY